MGPKLDGTNFEDFGLEDGDVFDVQVDGVDQTYTFTDPSDPFQALLYPLSGYSAQDVAKLLSSALYIKVSVEWLYDADSAYGYSTGLIARADGIYNKLVIKHGAAVSKLGFTEDSTVFGNFDNTHDAFAPQPEFVYLNAEWFDLVTQRAALYNSLGISNKLARPDSNTIIVNNMSSLEYTQIILEMQDLNRELIALQVLLQEPSMPGYNNAVVADASAQQFQSDSSIALFYDADIAVNYQGFIAPQKWTVDLQASDTTIIHGKDNGFGVSVYTPTSIVGQTSFAIITTNFYDRQILNNTVDGTMFSPILNYQDTSTTIDGTWLGFGAFGYNRDATFQIYSQPLFALKTDTTSSFTYYVDTTGLWIDGTSFSYSSYGNVTTMKSSINGAFPGLDATGNSIYDTSNPKGMIITGVTTIPPNTDATLYSGLRECFVNYWTIDDKNLRDRSSFDNTRIFQIEDRLNYLDIRENQIRNTFNSEEFFMSLDTSGEGNLYEWADNRFNRSVGCEARLKQIEKQIQVNQSGLQISKRFL
jgi:hypothetical protein